MERKAILSLAGLVSFIIIVLFLSNIYIAIYPSSNRLVDFTVEKGQGAKQISVELKEQGLIKYSSLFRFFVLIAGHSHGLQAGKYELSPAMSIAKIADKFTKGDVEKEKITIIEGWDLNDVAGYFKEQGICSKDYFFKIAEDNFNQGVSVLEDRPKDSNIEGYLFPDTYEVIPGTDAKDIVKKMLSNFDQKLTQDLRNDIENQKKTIFDIVTMASMIEKEVKTIEDKKIVSGILWKRISIGMPLQVDATVVYVLGHEPSLDDLQIDSSYNTYKYYGLPKGPISNPGLDSLVAAIYPVKTDYLYYLSAPSGQTIFSKTFADHVKAIRKYLK